jgi:hypothetical protein
MQARSRPVASSHISGDIRQRLVLHGEGASWAVAPLPCRGNIRPKRRPCHGHFSGSGGCAGGPLDFDDAAFYGRCNRCRTRGRQRRAARPDYSAQVRGTALPLCGPSGQRWRPRAMPGLCCNTGKASPATAFIVSASVCGLGVTSRQRPRSRWWLEASRVTWTPVVATSTPARLPQHVRGHGHVVLV